MTFFQLGMDDMFTLESKLNGLLADGEPILISDTIHKAFIEVNEGGSESAAATGNASFYLLNSFGRNNRKFFYAKISNFLLL